MQSALKVWLEVYRALQKIPRAEYGQWLRILKLDVQERSATVRIEVDNQAAFDRIRTQFEDSPYFRERAKNSSRIVELRAIDARVTAASAATSSSASRRTTDGAPGGP